MKQAGLSILLGLAICAWLGPAACLAQSELQAKPLSVVFDPKHQAVLSAEVSAKVSHIYKNLGQTFKAGEVLVELDSGMYQLNARKASAQVAAASKNYDVTSKLHQDKTASALDLENARKDAGVAQANLGLAQKEISSCRVLAPFSGRVKKVLVHEHEWTDKGKPLLEIVDDNLLMARILMPSSSFAKVKIGQSVSISVNETGQTVPGRIALIGDVLDPASGTFEVQAEVDNKAQALRAGMTGRVAMAESGGN